MVGNSKLINEMIEILMLYAIRVDSCYRQETLLSIMLVIGHMKCENFKLLCAPALTCPPDIEGIVLQSVKYLSNNISCYLLK
jgi:hypothetical protein